VEKVGTGERQPHAADAEERPLLRRQVDVGHLFVAADVERAHHERQAVQRPHHLAQRRQLLLLVGRVVAPEEQELGAQQPDALGPGLDGQRGLGRGADVGHHLDPVAVGGHGGLVAGAVLLGAHVVDPGLRLAGGVEVGSVDAHPQGPGVAVEHRGGVRGLGEQRRTGADEGRDAERPGDDRRVRRRPA
jgi:hypothetical protein